MSIASYERNVARGVAGPHLPVCFPASLEQVSPNHSYRPSVYNYYQDFVEWWGTVKPLMRNKPGYREEYTAMMDKLLEPLGGFTCSDIEFKRATSPMGWMRIVNRLLDEDYRLVVDIRFPGHKIGLFTCHTVGIVPTRETGYVTLASTNVPKPLEGIIPLQRVSERMYYVPEEFGLSRTYPQQNANIIALPPAA